MLNGRNNALRHSLNIILCPSIFWGPRLIARSPRRRRREKNLEPQKIDGISRLHVSCVKISIHYCATKITICIITPHVMVAKLHDSASWQHLAAGARSRNLGLIFSTISVFYNFNHGKIRVFFRDFCFFWTWIQFLNLSWFCWLQPSTLPTRFKRNITGFGCSGPELQSE